MKISTLVKIVKFIKNITPSFLSDMIINSEGGGVLEQIEFHIVDNCNLNCAYCDHFAPLAPKYQVPVEDFERDLSTLADIKGVKEKLTEFMLVGGEPLLHDNIEQLIEITRKYFKKAHIELITNCLKRKVKSSVKLVQRTLS